MYVYVYMRLRIYIYMVTHIARRGRLNRGKIDISPSSFAPENFVSRDGFVGSPVRVSLLVSILRLNLVPYLRDSSRVPLRRIVTIVGRGVVIIIIFMYAGLDFLV